MKFIVVGCGRVGSELVWRLFQNGHNVVVVDNDKLSFNRLHKEFRGRTVPGEALSKDTWEQAGMDDTDGVAVVTNLDTMNAVVGHLIRSQYPEVKQVLVRNYDPAMKEMLAMFDLQTVSSTAWGADRLQELLVNRNSKSLYSVGNGEVELYQIDITSKWNGATIAAFLSGCKEAVAVALTRAGRAQLPSADTQLESGDILTISATHTGVESALTLLEQGTEA